MIFRNSGPVLLDTLYFCEFSGAVQTPAISGSAHVESLAYDLFLHIIFMIIAVRGSGTMWAQIKVNGNVALDAVSEGSKADQDLQGSNMGIMNLNQGDRVWVYGSGSLPGNSNGNSNTRTSSFTGVLLYPKNN